MASAIEASTPRTIQELQQDFASNLGNRNDVIWDLLSSDQFEVLKNKIKELIPDPAPKETPNSGNSLRALLRGAVNTFRSSPSRELVRQTIIDNVWAQRKYTNGNSLTAILYVCVTPDQNLDTAANSRNYSVHPLFRARKCVDNDSSSACCIIFIDEIGRVYSNWEEYVNGNELPEGTLVAPAHGLYGFDDAGCVKLDKRLTPAASFGAKTLKAADMTATTGGLLSICVPVAAICSIPVAAPLVIGATAVGIVSAGYSAMRSGVNLIDRKQHELSIGLDNRQARSSWFGVAGGVVGIGAMSATRVMTSAAAVGNEVSMMTRGVVNGMNVSTIVLSGSSAADGILDLLLRFGDDDDISSLDILQLSASLLLFTHSVYNFKTAASLINETHDKTIKSYRKNLSNRQRRMFDKLSKETIRIRGEIHGKGDIVRNVNDIPSKQYLNDLFKVNQQLNKENVRPAFSSAGDGIILNNEIRIETHILRQNVHDTLSSVTQPVPAPVSDSAQNSAAVRPNKMLFASNPSRETQIGFSHQLALGVPQLIGSIIFSGGISISMSDFSHEFFEGISNVSNFEDLVTTAGEKLGGLVLRFLMRLTERFITEALERLRIGLQMFISTESVLYRIIIYITTNCCERTLEYLRSVETEIFEYVRNYFRSLNPHNNINALQKCNICPGSFAITTFGVAT